MSSSKEGCGSFWALSESWSCCVAVEIWLESSRMRAVEGIFGSASVGRVKLYLMHISVPLSKLSVRSARFEMSKEMVS